MGLEWKACLAFLVFLLAGCSSKTYDDCVLENVKGSSPGHAIVDIRKACERKYEPKKMVYNDMVGFIEFEQNTSETEMQKVFHDEIARKLSDLKKTKLELFREEFPEYSDVSTFRLMIALHDKFFKEIEFSEFKKIMGVNELKPEIGDVYDGQIFKGGDPKLKENWTKKTN